MEQQINAALALDLEARPRLKREGDGSIEVHKRKQTVEKERLMAVALARIWGLDNPSLTFMKRRWIEDAAYRQLAFNHGFP